MVDFLKIRVIDQDLINRLNQSDLLIWHDRKEVLSHFDYETIYTKETKIYKGILFCFYPEKLEILFRPHYYFNDNIHNANDLGFYDCINVIHEFVDAFKFKNLEKLNIVNLEFGLNIVVPRCVKDLITFLSYHNRNEFRTDDKLPYSKKSYVARENGKANTYRIIKAYAKSIQFSDYCEPNTFRFEIKSKKSQYINKHGIYNLKDLLRPSVLERLADEIIKEFTNVLIIDNDTTFQNLTDPEKRTLLKYLSNHTWYKILQNKTSRNSFLYHKKRYNQLLDKTGYNVHKSIKSVLSNKIDQLKFSATVSTYDENKISAPVSNYIVSQRTKHKNKSCPVTGLDISMQKEDSILLSNAGLKYYEEHNPEIFDFIKNQTLTGEQNKFEKDIYSKISKQIRNKYFNNPGIYAKEQVCLFN